MDVLLIPEEKMALVRHNDSFKVQRVELLDTCGFRSLKFDTRLLDSMHRSPLTVSTANTLDTIGVDQNSEGGNVRSNVEGVGVRKRSQDSNALGRNSWSKAQGGLTGHRSLYTSAYHRQFAHSIQHQVPSYGMLGVNACALITSARLLSYNSVCAATALGLRDTPSAGLTIQSQRSNIKSSLLPQPTLIGALAYRCTRRGRGAALAGAVVSVLLPCLLP